MVNEHHPGRAAIVIVVAALALFTISLAIGEPPVRAVAAAPSADDGFNRDLRNLFGRKPDPRERALDAFAKEIEAGITDLRLHYMKGGDWPPPPAVAIEFLLLRAADQKRQDLADLALGTAAIYASARVNDYVNNGHQLDSGGFEKKPIEEAGILATLTLAYRASGKDAFRTAAIRIGDDLASNLARPGGPSPAPAAAEQPQIAAALLEGGVIFERPAWLTAGRAITPASFTGARDLLASIEASPGRPGKTWAAAPPRLAGELLKTAPAKAAADPGRAGWSALALMQYGAFAHDDSARAVAIRIFDALPPPGTKPAARDPELFSAQAAAAMAAELYLNPAPMAYIVADPRSKATDALVQAAVRAYRPGRLVSVHSPKETDLLYPADSDGKPIVYVCSGELCAPPVAAPADVKALVETFALPEAAGDNPGVGRSPE